MWQICAVLLPTTIDLSDRGAADGTATTTTITTVAAAAATRFKRMIAAQPPSPDTSPLSDRLLSIKQVLNICLQTDLSISPTDIDEAAGVIKVPSMSRGSGAAAAAGGGLFGAAEPAPVTDLLSSDQSILPFNCNLYMEMHVDPAIHLIKQELEVVKAQVSADPEKYRRLLADLSDADRVIYNASFDKTIEMQHGGDEAAYTTMLQKCAALQSGRALVDVQRQPTSGLVPLVLMVRANIPQFKAAVEAVVAQAFPAAAKPTSAVPTFASFGFGAPPAAGSLFEALVPATEFGGLFGAAVATASSANVSFRPETKAPYRVIEKALTKGPNRNYPDCSNVLDVFGCLIDCADYVEMAAVVQAFADKHNAGEIDVTRVKDRWTAPSSGGWRDLMLNVAINGVVFEVQVVLHAMLVARKALDAHKAYNQFRSFAEVFNLLDLSPESETHMHGADNDGGDSGVAQHGSEVEELKRKLAASEEARAAAEGALAASAVRIVELEAEIERLTRSSSIPV